MGDIQSGQYGVITLQQCVESAKVFLRAETSDEDIFFEKLANEAIRHLDALSIFVKSFASLTIQDKKAKLPRGYHALIGLRFGSENNCAPITYVDAPFLNSCGCDSSGTLTGHSTYQIQNGCIHFNSNVVDGAEVALAYWGLNIDEDGLFVVHEDYERAITHYICWIYCLQNHNAYPANLAAKHEDIWKAQKKWIKSNDVKDHFQKNKRAMASTMRAVINAKTWLV